MKRLIVTILTIILFATGLFASQDTAVPVVSNVIIGNLDVAGVSIYDVVYINGSNSVAKADAYISDHNYNRAHGIYLGVTGQILVKGLIRSAHWNTISNPTWNAGDVLYLSETAGEISNAEPTTNGAGIQILGVVVDINDTWALLYFNPNITKDEIGLIIAGDLEMGDIPYSMDGGANGLAFDPNNDGINEILMPNLGGLKIWDYTLPGIDGTPGQVLTTDGGGNVGWEDASAISQLPDLTDVDPLLAYTNHFIFQADGTKYTGNTYSHTWLDDIGTNTHEDIDAHIADDSIHTEDNLLVHKAGSETITGEKTFSVFPITPSAPPDDNYEVANKKYVDDMVSLGISWKDPVLDIDSDTPPVSPNEGDRYIVGITGGDYIISGDQGNKKFYITGNQTAHYSTTNVTLVADSTGNNGWYTITDVTYNEGETRTEITVNETIPSGTFDGQIAHPATGAWSTIGGYKIVTYNGTGWDETIPDTGWAVITVDDGLGYTRTEDYLWTMFSSQTNYTAGDGLDLTGTEFKVNLKPNDGLKIDAGLLAVDYDNSTIGIVGNKLAVKNGGIGDDQLAGSIPDNKLATIITTDKVNWSAVNKTNSSIDDLFDVDTTGAGDGDVMTYDGAKWVAEDPIAGTSDYIYWDLTIHSHPASNLAWTNMPAAETELVGSSYDRKRVNLTGAVQYRIVINQAVAGYAGADLNAEYSINGTNWYNLDTGGTGECDVGTGTGVKVGAWTNIVVGAKTEVWLRLVGKQGDGIADPAWRQTSIQFKVNSTYIAGGSGGDLYTEYTVHSNPASSVAWTNMPLAVTELLNSYTGRLKADLSNSLQYRLMVDQTVAGATNADFNLQYSLNGTTWFTCDTAGAGELAVGAGTGVKYGAWVDLVTQANGDVWLRIVGKDGDGAADPQWRQIKVQFKNAVSGGSGIPGGSDTEVQFNDSDSFGGDSDFTYDKVDKNLIIGQRPSFPLRSGIFSSGEGQNSGVLASFVADDGDGCGILALCRAGGTISSPTAVQQGMRIGQVMFVGHDGVGIDQDSARIVAEAIENFSESAKGTKLDFYITPQTLTTPTLAAFLISNPIGATQFVVNDNSNTSTTGGFFTGYKARNGGSCNVGDLPILFFGMGLDSGNNQTQVGGMAVRFDNVTDGNEQGSVGIYTLRTDWNVGLQRTANFTYDGKITINDVYTNPRGNLSVAGLYGRQGNATGTTGDKITLQGGTSYSGSYYGASVEAFGAKDSGVGEGLVLNGGISNGSGADVKVYNGGSGDNWIIKWSQYDFGGWFGEAFKGTMGRRHYFNSDGETSDGYIYDFRRSRGTYGTPTTVVDTDTLGMIRFTGYTSVYTNQVGAYIKAIVNGTPGDGDMPTDLIFATSPDGSSTPIERLRIVRDGMVQSIDASARATDHFQFQTGSVATPVNTDGVKGINSTVYTTASNNAAFQGNVYSVGLDTGEIATVYSADLITHANDEAGTFGVQYLASVNKTAGGSMFTMAFGDASPMVGGFINDATLGVIGGDVRIVAFEVEPVEIGHNVYAWGGDGSVTDGNVILAYDALNSAALGGVGICTNILDPGAKLTVEGNIFPATDNTYYLGKNDDDDPKAVKGIIFKDQDGTGKYYRLEVFNNAIRIVDLTD